MSRGRDILELAKGGMGGVSDDGEVLWWGSSFRWWGRGVEILGLKAGI